MVAAEFIAELEKIRDQFQWMLAPDRDHQPDRRTRTRYRIRSISKNGHEGFIFDPIGAVCCVRTGYAYSDDFWLEASEALGLSPIDAGDLTAAANDLTWREAERRREANRYLQSLRSRLLIAVGLDFPD